MIEAILVTLFIWFILQFLIMVVGPIAFIKEDAILAIAWIILMIAYFAISFDLFSKVTVLLGR